MTETGLNIGMMWQSDKYWVTAVMEAADAYKNKYGKPELCVVHPDCFEEIERELAGIKIIKSKSILKKNYWIGSTTVKYDFIPREFDHIRSI